MNPFTRPFYKFVSIQAILDAAISTLLVPVGLLASILWALALRVSHLVRARNDKPRLLYFSAMLPLWKEQGVLRRITDHAPAEYFDKIHMLAYNDSGETPEHELFGGKVAVHPMNAKCLGPKSFGWHGLYYVANSFALILRALTLVYRYNIDLIRCDGALLPGTLGAVTAKLSGRGVVLYEGMNLTQRDIWYVRGLLWLERWAMRAASAIFLVDERAVARYRESGLPQAEFVPHAADVSLAGKDLPRPADMPADAYTFLYFGRLEVDKHVMDILDAFRAVSGEFPLARLLLIGRGSLAGELAARASEWGLRERVWIMDFKSQPELWPYLLACPVHVHPTGGKTVIESGLAARPVIVFKQNAWEYGLVEDHVTGLRVDYFNPADLAAAMRECLTHPARARQWGDALNRRVLDRHHPDAVRRITEAAYARALGRK